MYHGHHQFSTTQSRPRPLARNPMQEPTLNITPATVVVFVPPPKTAVDQPFKLTRPDPVALAAREAMFICTLERVAEAFASNPDVDLVLCIDIDSLAAQAKQPVLAPSQRSTVDKTGRYTISAADLSPETPLDHLPPEAAPFDVFPQAPGTLGERLAMTWQILGCGRVVFLGINAPDIPLDTLRAILPQLDTADLLVGQSPPSDPPATPDSPSHHPAHPPAFWALAANRYRLGLLEAIDYAAPNVYHQLSHAARRADLTPAQLPHWPASHPANFAPLLQRLAHAADPALVRLRDRLLAITAPDSPGPAPQ